jgi:hypothetical protein
MKNNLLSKTTKIILRLINALERDIEQNLISLKDKKVTMDLINKLFPIILKLDKMKALEDDKKISDNVSENDLRIISDFLQRKSGSERGI